MRVTTYSDPEVFLVQAEPLLRSDPFRPNVIATVTTRIASGTVPGGPDHLWITIERNDAEIVSLAMRTPPHNMFVSRMPEEAALVLAREMADSGRNLPGDNGATASTRIFARAWEQSTGRSRR